MGGKAMEKARRFQDLKVWQKSHQFVLEIYKLTRSFPDYELFGLTSQMRRAAVSIPANIAEGFKRRGKADKVRFFNISQGSLEETRYYLILASDLVYAETGDLQFEVDEVGRLLDAYMKAIILQK
jgi:four helix bundle protein